MPPLKSSIILTICSILLLAGGAPLHARDFSSRDQFAFANETVWDYAGKGKEKAEAAKEEEKEKEKYSRRCFVMSRAALQFWKFARFDAASAPVDNAELARRVREVCDRDVWKDPLPRAERIVFPGYADLRAFSADPTRADVLKKNIGLGWPTYFRVGNFCIIYPPGKGSMTETNRRLAEALKKGEPQTLWLVNFPSLTINHVVVVYADAGSDKKTARYRVYDPNYSDRNFVLAFDRERGIFSYPKTFYFAGGDVRARIVYTGVFE